MRYQRVCLEAIGYVLPPEIVTSQELETQLAPLYQRLRLPEGRLELITGVHERRFWHPGTLPSEMSAHSAQLALEAGGWPADRVGALLHASVCRDFLEPATACGVHHALKMPRDAVIYDISNACLGLLNGILQAANMIELRQVEAALVVGTEGSRQLVETTVASLNQDHQLTRAEMKMAMASLTIGSASCALLLVDRDLSRSGTQILGGHVRANTDHHQLCRSGRDEAVGSGMQPLMRTDSERLLQEGVATGAETFERFLQQLAWQRSDIDKTICHQVGPAHRRLMLEQLQLDPQGDFSTVEWLGNTGSVALPITLGLAAQRSHVKPHDSVALLGIGSGINCVMIGAQWETCQVIGADLSRCAPALAAEAPGTAKGSPTC